MELSKKYVFSLFFILVVLFTYFFTFHVSRPLLDYDESIYAQVARQAYESGDQFGFKWFGNNGLQKPWLGAVGLQRSEYWFEKPPLMIWLVESSYYFFGQNEVAARLWNIVFAVGLLLITFLFTVKIFKSYSAAFFAVTIYSISLQFLQSASILGFDIPVSFFIFFALCSFYIAQTQSKWYYAFWIALALGVLCKSVVGLLPIPIIVLYSLFRWDVTYLKSKDFFIGAGIFVIVVLPWHIIESIRYGKLFWQEYVLYHVTERFVTPLEGNGGSILFYVHTLYSQNQLFTILAFLSVVYAVIKSRSSDCFLYMTSAVIFIFLFFSIAQTKLPSYILTIYPFVAVLIGLLLDAIINKIARAKKIVSTLSMVVLFILVILGCVNAYHVLKTPVNQYIVDSKEIGEVLQHQFLDIPIFYYSTIGTKPSIIFYANRIVYYLHYPDQPPVKNLLLISELPPPVPNSRLIFSTSTQKVYQISSKE